MSKKPSVYVIQAPISNVDLSTAADQGTIKFCLPQYFQPSLDPKRGFEMLRNELKHFKHGDFITSIGADLAGVLMAGMVLPEFTEDNAIKWLRWEKRKLKDGVQQPGYYVPVNIDYDGD